MKLIFIFFIILMLNNCSLNKDSKFWTENIAENIKNQKKSSDALKKPKDITTMSFKEYEIFIDDYTKKSKYPNISQ